jgi:hypothetical protein
LSLVVVEGVHQNLLVSVLEGVVLEDFLQVMDILYLEILM